MPSQDQIKLDFCYNKISQMLENIKHLEEDMSETEQELSRVEKSITEEQHQNQ